MESEKEQLAADMLDRPVINIVDVLLLGGLLSFGAYWLLMRKKTPEFDASSIKTYTFEPTVVRQSSIATDGFVNKLKNTNRNMVIFYGSQTGTAEEFAGRLAKESNRYAMKAMVADPEECDMEELTNLPQIENSFAVFFMATYGEGDPTDNALEFIEWLKNGSADLKGLNYAVFGLGNKTYEHYNETGIYVDKRLAELGATRVAELGLGDDDYNIEEDYITWKDRLWASVCEHFDLQSSGEDINLRQYQLIVHNDLPKEKIYTGEVLRLNSVANQRPPYDVKNPYLAPVLVNKELYKGSRSCMHVEVDIAGAKMRYEAGDHVGVYPQNDKAAVETLGRLLNCDLDTVITLKNLDEESSKKSPFPCPCSYRTALTYYIDITHPPRTHILKEIMDFSDNEEEKQLLKTMSSSSEEGKHLYSEWIIKSCRSIVHVLEDLPSVKPPLDHLLEVLPRLQARYYSISSSPKVHPEAVHMTAVLVEYETPTRRTNRGVTTSWLKDKLPGAGERVSIFFRRSQFKLPAKHQTPIVMIGPGTGLAPFRGFIQERHWQKEQGKPVGDTILYFGCRKQAEDYLYKEELERYTADGTLKLYTAFSRDQSEKVYVTHLLRQNMKELWDIIGERSGHVYICGDARNMARDVRDILIETIEVEGNKTKQEAEAYLKKMESQRRYSADVWS
ncbi:NADPH--cytochrome P450 reductase [Halotydeus destructor]|nr:NADPH--cytochrome P450 reductase [Halotydeus destructor]